MTKTVSQQLVSFLLSHIALTKANHTSALEAYAQSVVREKMAKFQYEKDDSSGNLLMLTHAIIRSVEMAESLKEMDRLYSLALHELSLVKQPLQHLELAIDHRLVSSQGKFERVKTAFQSKLGLLKSGRKSLTKRIARMTRDARAYYTLARRQVEHYRRLESAIKSLLIFDASDQERQNKLQQTTQSIVTSRHELKDAKADLRKFVKLAKRQGIDVDIHLFNDCESRYHHETGCSTENDLDDESASDGCSNKDAGSDSEHDSEHDSEDDADSEIDKDSDSDSDSDAENDSDTHSGSDSGQSDEPDRHHNRGCAKRKGQESAKSLSSGHQSMPTLTDYLTNNPFDFYLKFIKPRIPEQSIANPLDLIGMFTHPITHPTTTAVCKPVPKTRKTARK